MYFCLRYTLFPPVSYSPVWPNLIFPSYLRAFLSTFTHFSELSHPPTIISRRFSYFPISLLIAVYCALVVNLRCSRKVRPGQIATGLVSVEGDVEEVTGRKPRNKGIIIWTTE
ncbi:hypothetical protein BDV39DRAFT_37057 [Aspergillus sergii]|uniref:Uncharacterized protein n=1 Tax=Aspergillus sergii TaxID=1034303 RepID=A0A5N6XF57_9EURO|nr:hypothetical protein BDV39DRAFT_37057 [Aspergillus sergii]